MMRLIRRIFLECTCSASWQEGLLVGLSIRDLVDHNAHTALGDDVGDAVANLDVDDLYQLEKKEACLSYAMVRGQMIASQMCEFCLGYVAYMQFV